MRCYLANWLEQLYLPRSFNNENCDEAKIAQRILCDEAKVARTLHVHSSHTNPYARSAQPSIENGRVFVANVKIKPYKCPRTHRNDARLEWK